MQADPCVPSQPFFLLDQRAMSLIDRHQSVPSLILFTNESDYLKRETNDQLISTNILEWVLIAWLARLSYLQIMNQLMDFIIFQQTYSGRLLLWPPLKIYKYFLRPPYFLNSLLECLFGINLSSLPLMKIIMVSGLIFRKSSMISSSSISKSARCIISLRNLQKTQGNKQLIKRSGTKKGAFCLASSLLKSLKEEKEESATITGAFPNFKAVAAPILLPHNITLSPSSSRKLTMLCTCQDSLTPKLIVSCSQFCPHPMKSKQAIEKLRGRCLMIPKLQTREAELP